MKVRASINQDNLWHCPSCSLTPRVSLRIFGPSLEMLTCLAASRSLDGSSNSSAPLETSCANKARSCDIKFMLRVYQATSSIIFLSGCDSINRISPIQIFIRAYKERSMTQILSNTRPRRTVDINQTPDHSGDWQSF